MNPNHDDSNPSMRINQHTGLYHCFSCGYSGNLLIENEVINNMSSILIQKLKSKIRDITVQSNTLDFPAGATPYYYEYRNISADTFFNFNVFTVSGEPFEDRIVVPITNILGEVQCFIARDMYNTKKSKYIFQPKHVKPTMFPAVVKGNKMLLVEGIFDMLNLWDKGIKYTVTTHGLSIGTIKNKYKIEEKLKEFSTYKLQGIEKVYILFDGDDPGRKAAVNMEKHLATMFNKVERIDLPDGLDPGDMTVQQVNKLKELIE